MQTPKLDIENIAVGESATIGRTEAGRLPANDMLRVQVYDRMETLESEWRDLEKDNLLSLHQSYDWCTAWVETYRNPLAILHGSYGGRTAFILPLEIVRANMVRTAQFIAGGRSNINTGLFSADFSAALAGGLTSSQQDVIIQALQGKADLAVLQNIPAVWRGRESPLAGLPVIENQNHAFQLPLLGSFDETLKQLNAKRRRKKYRQQTRILDDLGGYDHVTPETPQEQHELLELFFHQKAVRFREAGLPDVFHASETRSFLHRLIDASASGSGDAVLAMHAIRLRGTHEGHIPAVAAVSRKGDHVICQFTSIDETTVPTSSPGELLFWLLVEHYQQQGAALFDFGIGDQLYKRSWCPVETVHYDAILPISALGHVAAFAQRGVTRAKAAIKANPQIYSFIQKLRSQTTGTATSTSQPDED